MVENKKKQKTGVASFRLRQELFAWSFVFIPLLLMIISWVFVNGQSLLMAFQTDLEGWGFKNFRDIYKNFTDPFSSGGHAEMILNTITYFACQEFIGIPISLFVSYFIYKRIQGYKAFRVIFYLPSIIPAMVFVTSFSQICEPGGVLETIAKSLGAELPFKGVLHEEATARTTLIVYMLLTTAAGNILFYSAMSRVPPELIEAGKIDGLTLIKEFFYIDFPLILPTFAMTLLLDCASLINFGPPILLFGNPPGTSTIAFWFFNEVYVGGVMAIGKYGYMSALGLCFTTVMLPIVLFVRWLAEKVDVSY